MHRIINKTPETAKEEIMIPTTNNTPADILHLLPASQRARLGLKYQAPTTEQVERAAEFAARAFGVARSDLEARPRLNAVEIKRRARDGGGGYHIADLYPVGGGYDVVIVAPNALYFGADGSLHLSDDARDYAQGGAA